VLVTSGDRGYRLRPARTLRVHTETLACPRCVLTAAERSVGCVGRGVNHMREHRRLLQGGTSEHAAFSTQTLIQTDAGNRGVRECVRCRRIQSTVDGRLNSVAGKRDGSCPKTGTRISIFSKDGTDMLNSLKPKKAGI
jgi:hypothetical protein